MRRVGNVARMEDKRNAYKILVETSECKRLLRRQMRRWKDNIKMNLGEIEWEGVNFIDIAEGKDK
jgi:hypothetical protein